MSQPAKRGSSRADRMLARWSRRPSRLGTAAGAAPEPDRTLDREAGFPSLLKQVWAQAAAAPTLDSAIEVLLTLGGHVPADVQLRAMRLSDEIAVQILTGRSWREGFAGRPEPGPGEVAFVGELGLTTSGRIVLRAPSTIPLAGSHDLLDATIRVPWSAGQVSSYGQELALASARAAAAVTDCRQWLAQLGEDGRRELLELLTEAARRTAPFMLYQADRQYTNFRDLNTITGKTLWPGHPDCALSSLQQLPIQLWSDEDVLLISCLQLLVASAGFARIEEANGTQLTPDHVGHLLERVRRQYDEVPGGQPLAPAGSNRMEALYQLAGALRASRSELIGQAQLYREIHGALMHKVERVAGPPGELVRQREREVCAELSDELPISGRTFEELGAALTDDHSWLSQPYGEFGSGLELLIHRSVRAATAAFAADFAMSRGLRSLPELIAALQSEDWATIASWEIKEYFCCVVPDPRARRYFADSAENLADIAWSMAARMQYNSWHFIVGLLPKVPAVVARDHFVPPSIPDIAYYSDQHHHGHVAARVRFSIRSPQPVAVAGRIFNGFVDLRLLRCEGMPFTEQDLLAAHRLSEFIAQATTLAAQLVLDGDHFDVTAFDTRWHWESIAGPQHVSPAGTEPALR